MKDPLVCYVSKKDYIHETLSWNEFEEQKFPKKFKLFYAATMCGKVTSVGISWFWPKVNCLCCLKKRPKRRQGLEIESLRKERDAALADSAELKASLKSLLDISKPSNMLTINAEPYRTPSEQLRYQADCMDYRDSVIYKAQFVLQKHEVKGG